MERKRKQNDVLKPVHKKRLYEDVEKQLIQLVDQGEVEPGGKFPTEMKLAEQLQVSPSILREAFRILETKGIVESVQGGGRYLKKRIEWNASTKAATLLDVYEVRLVLEPLAARMATLRSKREDIDKLSELLCVLKEDGRDEDEDFRFHIAVARMSQNAVLSQMVIDMLNAVGSTSDEAFPQAMWDMTMEDYMADHFQILDAMRHGEPEEAGKRMYQHIEKSYLLIKG